MEVITPRSLTDALREFKDRADERWVDQDELEAQSKALVDEYLEDKSGLTDEDMEDILGA